MSTVIQGGVLLISGLSVLVAPNPLAGQGLPLRASTSLGYAFEANRPGVDVTLGAFVSEQWSVGLGVRTSGSDGAVDLTTVFAETRGYLQQWEVLGVPVRGYIGGRAGWLRSTAPGLVTQGSSSGWEVGTVTGFEFVITRHIALEYSTLFFVQAFRESVTAGAGGGLGLALRL